MCFNFLILLLYKNGPWRKIYVLKGFPPFCLICFPKSMYIFKYRYGKNRGMFLIKDKLTNKCVIKMGVLM